MSAPFTRILILFDVHFPEHDRAFIAAIESWLRVNWIHRLVMAGDFADMESASSHGGNPNQPKVVEDVHAVKAGINSLKKAALAGIANHASTQCWDAWDLELDLLWGNHETRLARLIASIAPMLHGMVSLESALEPLGGRIVPEDKQPISYGSLDVLHGHQLSGGGQWPAKKLAETYGMPGRTVAMGHLHRSQVYSKPMHPEPATGMVVGCGRSLKPSWQHGTANGWRHEFLIADVLPDGTTIVHPVKVVNGTFSWGDQTFRG